MVWNKSVNTFTGKLDMLNGNGERHPGDTESPSYD